MSGPGMRDGFTVLDAPFAACIQCGEDFYGDMAHEARYGVHLRCRAAYIKATSGHVGNSKTSDAEAKLVFEAWLREPGAGETDERAADRCRKLGIGG